MKLQRNGRYVTRDGRIVRHLVYLPSKHVGGMTRDIDDEFPWKATVTDAAGTLAQEWYTESGHWSAGYDRACRLGHHPTKYETGADLLPAV